MNDKLFPRSCDAPDTPISTKVPPKAGPSDGAIAPGINVGMDMSRISTCPGAFSTCTTLSFRIIWIVISYNPSGIPRISKLNDNFTWTPTLTNISFETRLRDSLNQTWRLEKSMPYTEERLEITNSILGFCTEEVIMVFFNQRGSRNFPST